MPISPESSYCLDHMVVFGEIMTDEYAFTMNRNIDIDGVVDVNGSIKDFVVKSFETEYSKMTDGERGYYDLTLLLDSSHPLDELLTHFASTAAHGYTRHHGIHSPRMHQQLYTDFTISDYNDPNDIQKIITYIDNGRFTKMQNFLRIKNSYERAITNLATTNVDDIIVFGRELKLRQQELREQYRREAVIAQMTETERPFIDSAKRIAINNKQQKIGRKVVKKSYEVLKQFVGEDKTKAFINGNRIVIEGHNFNFHLEKGSVNIVDHSSNSNRVHIPYKLDITDKSNIHLAQLCMYFKDTPILDQILAIHLHVANGEEDQLIKIANFMKTTDAARKNEKLIELGKIKTLHNDEGLGNMFAPQTAEQALADEQFWALRDNLKGVLANAVGDYLGFSPTVFASLLNPQYNLDAILDRQETPELLALIQLT